MILKKSIFLAALAGLLISGCGGGSNSGSTPVTPTAATPVFSPASGTFTAAQSVTLSDSTTGAKIYYTTDGTSPSASSTLYSSAITVASSTTINAVAIASGYNNSSVATGTYTISLPAAATPTFAPTPGTYSSAQSVTLADTTAGASIYYTTDGSTPTSASAKYSAAIPVNTTTTVKAIAVASGYSSSAVASGTYTINLPAASTPSFTPTPGTYTSAQSVTLADATAGASIYYTTDGSTPTAASSLYSAAIPVSTTTTIKAIAVASGYSSSAVASGAYTINLPAAATPTFTPTPGTYTSAQSVTLADTTTGAAIHYTTDGSTPTASSTLYSAAIPVGSTTTINAIAIASGYSKSAVATGTYTFAGSASSVDVYLTTHDQTNLLAKQSSLTFKSSTGDATTNTVVVDVNQKFQTIEGFGAAFTDSTAYLLNEVAQSSQVSSIMSDLFTRSGSGIGLSFMRTQMGASDISRKVYSYDDQSTGSTDLTLSQFSIAHDNADQIPVILEAQSLNPSMKLLASPWSPPAWMKDPTSMSPVTMQGGSLLMTDANEKAYADYFVKFLKAYEAAGVKVDYLTIQNEPLYVTNSYPSMGISSTNALALLHGYVLPALKSASIDTKVMVYDHNWDSPTYPQTVLNGLTSDEMTQIAGIAWHGYGGTAGSQQNLHNLFPNLGQWMTEHSGGTWNSDQFTTDYLDIAGVMRSWGSGFIKWSLALDQNLGPNLARNAGMGGCNTCTPIVTVNSQTGDVTKAIEYYTIGQYSKFVLPGAKRIYSNNTPAILSAAFLNTDGSIVLVAYNGQTTAQSFNVQWGSNQSFTYSLPAQSAASFIWSGNQSGTPLIDATSQISASSFADENGLAIEGTSDATTGFDLGYISNNSYIRLDNVDFGTAGSITSVKLRSASNGSGGTATFYLDSMTSTPIAKITLPITGGWQAWKTTSAAVSNLSGVHSLYVVFSGTTNSIANVNWLQFQ